MNVFLNALLAAIVAGASPGAVDFRGHELGSSLEMFRSGPAPAGSRPVCSNDSNHDWLRPAEGMAQAGVVICSFEEQIGSSRVRADMPLSPSPYSATVEFYFHEGRLFRIEAYLDAPAAATIEEALTAKLGNAAEARQATFQTKAGAVFPQAVRVWRRGTQTVTLTAPDLTTQRMSVIYVDVPASERLAQRVRQIVDPAKVM